MTADSAIPKYHITHLVLVSGGGRKRGGHDYTPEERQVLASLRKSSGRTCHQCEWYSDRGKHRGCFPNGKYRKFLSQSEFDAGCERFLAKESSK